MEGQLDNSFWLQTTLADDSTFYYNQDPPAYPVEEHTEYIENSQIKNGRAVATSCVEAEVRPKEAAIGSQRLYLKAKGCG